jgi:N-acetylmuramoyl-L-alanine amidase
VHELLRILKPDSPLVADTEASPNHGERKGADVDALVLHYTGMDSGEAALARLCDPATEVSAHYLVWEDGRIHQLVPEARRAWHAGQSFWAGERDMNAVSVGIEIVNAGHDGGLPPYPDSQIAALIALCHDIRARHDIPQRRILAHSDIAPSRKQDPGEHFPWSRLARGGIGHWVTPHPIDGSGILHGLGDSGNDVLDLQATLAAYGYDVDLDGKFGPQTEAAVAAFQRHFRPTSVDGGADRSTLDTLREVLARA